MKAGNGCRSRWSPPASLDVSPKRLGAEDMNAEIAIRLKRLPHGEGLPLPAYANDHAAGMDVVAVEDVTLAPGARHAVANGVSIAIQVGFEVQDSTRPEIGRD